MRVDGGQIVRSMRQGDDVRGRKVTRGTARRILSLAAPYRGPLTVFLGLVVLTAVIGAANPLLYKEIINRGITGHRAGLVIALGLAIASPLASSHPDGLQWVAKQKGFLAVAQQPLYRMIPGYVFPGVSNATLATILAGIVGALIVFGVTLGVALSRRYRQSATH